jgi:hypothetical protein
MKYNRSLSLFCWLYQFIRRLAEIEYDTSPTRISSWGFVFSFCYPFMITYFLKSIVDIWRRVICKRSFWFEFFLGVFRNDVLLISTFGFSMEKWFIEEIGMRHCDEKKLYEIFPFCDIMLWLYVHVDTI